MKTKMTARTLTMALAAMAVATAFGQGDEIAPIQIGQPTPPVQAQSAPGPRLEIRLRVLREGLQLTDEQAAKVRAILEETRKSGQAVRAQQDLKPEERRQKLDTLHEAEREKLLQVFTEEQREKFSKMPPAAAPQGPVGEGFPVIPIPGQRGPGAQGARVPGQPGVPMPPMQGGPGFGHQGGPGLGPQGRRGTQGGPGGPGFGPPGRRGQGPQGGMMPP
ncbi:MAG: hypothetical protein HZC36_02105, partial [Armatimonadetes bacterium]|nr:hypothetical protein [Armatimonadota bacterium]